MAGRGGRGAGEAGIEILLDQAAGFEGGVVIGIVIPTAEDIGAEHDAALDFFAKALGA